MLINLPVIRVNSRDCNLGFFICHLLLLKLISYKNTIRSQADANSAQCIIIIIIIIITCIMIVVVLNNCYANAETQSKELEGRVNVNHNIRQYEGDDWYVCTYVYFYGGNENTKCHDCVFFGFIMRRT